jgi:hypothetical protein
MKATELRLIGFLRSSEYSSSTTYAGNNLFGEGQERGRRMWGASIFRYSSSSDVQERPSTLLRCGSRTTIAKTQQRQPGQ